MAGVAVQLDGAAADPRGRVMQSDDALRLACDFLERGGVRDFIKRPAGEKILCHEAMTPQQKRLCHADRP
jgi:hypothetical protein